MNREMRAEFLLYCIRHHHHHNTTVNSGHPVYISHPPPHHNNTNSHTMKSVGRTQYFLNPYTFTNNTADVRTEFYNLRSNGNLEQILTKSRRRNSWQARVSKVGQDCTVELNSFH